jgi:hypothetical protein
LPAKGKKKTNPTTSQPLTTRPEGEIAIQDTYYGSDAGWGHGIEFDSNKRLINQDLGDSA